MNTLDHLQAAALYLWGAPMPDPTDPVVDPVVTPPAPVDPGTLVSAVVNGTAAVAADTDAVNAANAKLTADQAKLTSDTSALAADLKTSGGIAVVGPTSVTAYEPDGAGGIKVSTLRLVPTTAPAPTPPPAA